MPLQFEIKVVPGSGRSTFVLDKAGQLKCFLKNQAQDGKANLELMKLLAKNLGVTMADITIVMGATSRKKVLRINSSMTYEQLLVALHLDQQQALFK
jgi:uncharacterized protein (TIGR00251 family)